MIAQELKDFFRETLVAQRTITQEFAALDALVDFVSQNDHTSIPDWTSGLTFQLDGSDDGAFCTEPDTNGRIRFFKTKVNNNTGNSPPTDPLITENTYWIEVSPSDGSSVKEWTPGVYGSGLVIVYFDTSGTGADPDLYVLAEPTRPFNSTNFTTELAAGKWKRMQTVFDVAGTGGTDVMNIGTTNADVINIGRVGATVNIYGNTIYSQVTNLEVSDKLIRLNRGGAAASAGGSGFELEENSVITGYIKTSSDRNSYEMKAPNVAYKATFSFSTLAADRSYTLPNNSGTLALLSDIGGGGWSLASGGTLTGNNIITGTSFTLKGVWTALGTAETNGYGWWLANTTAAAAGSQQYSPTFVQEGNAWETTGSASRSIKFSQQVKTTQGIASEITTGYQGSWVLSSSRDGAAYAPRITVNSLGGVQIDGVFGQNSFRYKTGGASFFLIDLDGQSYYYYSLAIRGSGTQSSAFLQVAPAAQTSAFRKTFESIPGNNTNITAATEFIANDFTGATWTWNDGTVATQRFNYFKGFTVNKTTTAATFTNIYTMYVDACTAGTGVTFTNNWAAGFAGNIQVGSGSTGKIDLIGSSSVQINSASNTQIQINQGGSTRFTIGGAVGPYWFNGYNAPGLPVMTITQVASTSGSTPGLVYTGAAHTAQTTGTELIDWNLNFNRTITFAGSTGYTTQRTMYVQGATYAFASPTGTITNAYTLYVDPPVAGTNSSITNKWAAGFNGDVQVGNQLYLGNISMAGATRVIGVLGSATDIGLQINTKGTGALTIYGNSMTIGGAAYASGSVGVIRIQGNNSATSDQAGSSIEIISGLGAAGNANSGNILLDLGAKSGTGIVGSIGLFSTSTDFDGGEKVLRIGARTTAPSGTIVADHAYLYVQDIAAGNAAIHTMTEAGDIVKLYAISGWGTPTNTLTRTTFDTSTVTLQQLAERVGALISDLKTGHGLLKA